MKEEQRIALTKRLLREGLLRLLQNKDIDKVNIKELCEESGINRATFYRHYETPRDILKEIRHEVFEEARILAEHDHAEKNPLRWLKDICEYFYANAATLNLLFKTKTDDEFIELLNDIYAKYFVGSVQFFAKGDVDSDNLKLAAYFYASGIYCVIRQWLLEPIGKTPEQVAGLIYSFITAQHP